MVNDLLSRAARSKSPVRAAAVLRIARVQTAFDRGQARITLEIALEEVQRLKGRERESMLQLARLIAAAVAPDLLDEIPSGSRSSMREFESGMLVKTMLDHNLTDAAFKYVSGYNDLSTIPLGYIPNVVHKMKEDGPKLELLRHATEAWRKMPDNHSRSDFLHIFLNLWKLMPQDEARDLAREIVRDSLDRPDRATTAGYFESVVFTSHREYTLFEIIDVLQHLDPPLAESLATAHEQLRSALRRFPHGRESIFEESEERRKKSMAEGAACGGGFGMSGDPKDRPYIMAMMQASKDGDFGPAIAHALEQYQEDTDPASPNLAPKPVWPSTSSFRSILYQAGRQMGADAAVYLDRVPEDDLRLFAHIELEAALAGLPELQAIQSQYRPPQRPGPQGDQRVAMRAANGDQIRCPQCGWHPCAEDRWGCKCGHSWNTFSTGGRCPACQYQWERTLCYGCHEVSPHKEWYVLG
jgi:hypothetical protein